MTRAQKIRWSILAVLGCAVIGFAKWGPLPERGPYDNGYEPAKRSANRVSPYDLPEGAARDAYYPAHAPNFPVPAGTSEEDANRWYRSGRIKEVAGTRFFVPRAYDISANPFNMGTSDRPSYPLENSTRIGFIQPSMMGEMEYLQREEMEGRRRLLSSDAISVTIKPSSDGPYALITSTNDKSVIKEFKRILSLTNDKFSPKVFETSDVSETEGFQILAYSTYDTIGSMKPTTSSIVKYGKSYIYEICSPLTDSSREHFSSQVPNLVDKCISEMIVDKLNIHFLYRQEYGMIKSIKNSFSLINEMGVHLR